MYSEGSPHLADRAAFPQYGKARDAIYFQAFGDMVRRFMGAFPSLRRINQDMLWLHVLTRTLLYAKCAVEGLLPNTGEAKETVFQFLTPGLSGHLRPGTPEQQ